jgi:predicted transcriptional regulator
MSTTQKKQRPAEQAYDAWYDEQIRLGLEDFELGRLVSHDDAVKHLEKRAVERQSKHTFKAT